MSAWRRKALALFPEDRREIEDPRTSIYLVFMLHALPAVRAEHDAGTSDRLPALYGFAEWCLRQKAKDIWNAAGVSFYEHVFDGPKADWSRVVPWLSQYAVDNCAGLWEWRLGANDYNRVRELLARAGRPVPPTGPSTSTSGTPVSRRPERRTGPRRAPGRPGPGR